MKVFRTVFCTSLVVAIAGCQTPHSDLLPADVRQSPGLYQQTIDPSTPFDSVKARADAGDPNAQNEIGARYGAREPEKAFKYYSLAAAQGLAVAQCNLAYMYLTGEATRKDETKAVEWYSKCARQGHFMGEYALGRMYATGEGLSKNGRLAEQWFLLAANQGNIEAQQALLYMYENGVGIPKDPQKAIVWLHRVRDATISGQPWKQK